MREGEDKRERGKKGEGGETGRVYKMEGGGNKKKEGR